MPGRPRSVSVMSAACACVRAVHSSRYFSASSPMAACAFGNRSVYCGGQRLERPDVLPEVDVRIRAEPRRDPEDRERADREHPGADEDPLQLAGEEPLRDTRFVGPRLGVRQRAHAPGQLGVADERQAAAVAVQRLQRLEAEEARVAEGADRPAVAGRPERVCAVLDHDEAVPLGDRHDAIHVARQAVEVGRHDRPRPLGDRRLEGVGVEREGGRVDVGEDDLQAAHARQFGNHPEGERRDDDLRAGRQLERLQDVVEGHAAVRGRDGVAAARPGGERRLEGLDLRPLDERAAPAVFRDDLFGVRKDARPVPGDGGQHVTGRDMSTVSCRACRSSTLRSRWVTHRRTEVFCSLRRLARYDGRM